LVNDSSTSLPWVSYIISKLRPLGRLCMQVGRVLARAKLPLPK
jgi:hypothetical protein